MTDIFVKTVTMKGLDKSLRIVEGDSAVKIVLEDGPSLVVITTSRYLDLLVKESILRKNITGEKGPVFNPSHPSFSPVPNPPYKGA